MAKQAYLAKCLHCEHWSPSTAPCRHCGAPLPEATIGIDYEAPVFVPCQHCNQMGAVTMECARCGAPIDPVEFLIPSPAPVEDPYWHTSTEYWVDGDPSKYVTARDYTDSDWNI